MSWNEHQPVKLDWMKEYYETERIYKQNRTRVYILFGIGMLLNLGLWIWYAKAEGYHPVLEQLQIISPTWKNQFFLYLDEWKRSDIGMRMFGSVILLGMVVGEYTGYCVKSDFSLVSGGYGNDFGRKVC